MATSTHWLENRKFDAIQKMGRAFWEVIKHLDPKKKKTPLQRRRGVVVETQEVVSLSILKLPD